MPTIKSIRISGGSFRIGGSPHGICLAGASDGLIIKVGDDEYSVPDGFSLGAISDDPDERHQQMLRAGATPLNYTRKNGTFTGPNGQSD